MSASVYKQVTVIADEIRGLLRKEIAGGWTCDRIAYEMQKAGHKEWKATTVQQTSTGKRQVITIDEAVALLAVFKSKAKMLEKELDRIVASLNGDTKR